jgi:hypothetical protein
MSDALFDDDAYRHTPTFDEAIPDPRAVACPTCRAKVGSPCKRPSGHTVFGGGHHAPRIQLARGLSDGNGTVPADAQASVEPEDRPPT